jgi:hypothetical protein
MDECGRLRGLLLPTNHARPIREAPGLVGISLQGNDPVVEVGPGNRIRFSSFVRADLLTF